MKRRLLQVLLSVGDRLGVNILFRRINRRNIRILMYHGIVSEPPPFPCWTAIRADQFARQMQYVSENYRVVPADTLGGETESTLDNRVVITFDDGLKNTLTVAGPILREMGLQATVFVLPRLSEAGGRIWADNLYEKLMLASAGTLDLTSFGLGELHLAEVASGRGDTANRILDTAKSLGVVERERFIETIYCQLKLEAQSTTSIFDLMTRDEIMACAEADEFAIGPHTDTHPILSHLTPAEQEREIEGCIARLREWRTDPISVFAYPNGRLQDFDDASVQAVRGAGLTAALTTVDGHHIPGGDRYRIWRIAIGADCSLREFKARLSGFYYFLQRLAGRREESA